jgi:hypothetical protein
MFTNQKGRRARAHTHPASSHHTPPTTTTTTITATTPAATRTIPISKTKKTLKLQKKQG